MSSTVSSLQAIIDSLTAALADAEKFDAGNSSAGTRVRAAAQEAVYALKDLRVSVQETKNASKAGNATTV